MDTGIRVAFAVVCLLLFAHLVILPLAKRRPVLLRGREAFVFAVTTTVFATSFASWWFAVPLGAVVAAVLWWRRPWVAFGIPVQGIQDAAVHAGKLLRWRVVPTGDATLAIGATGVVRLRRLIGVWVQFEAKRTPRLALFQNVLRKSVENYRLGTG